MKKLVLRLDLHDDKGKKKAMKSVSGLPGIDSIAMDMKKRELTVVGDVDPIVVVSKLRKLWPGTDIVSVGPEKEPEKKKDDGKKDEAKKDDDKKKDDGKPKDPNEQLAEYIKAYHKVYNPYMATQYYHLHSAEENPNSCVIC